MHAILLICLLFLKAAWLLNLNRFSPKEHEVEIELINCKGLEMCGGGVFVQGIKGYCNRNRQKYSSSPVAKIPVYLSPASFERDFLELLKPHLEKNRSPLFHMSQVTGVLENADKLTGELNKDTMGHYMGLLQLKEAVSKITRTHLLITEYSPTHLRGIFSLLHAMQLDMFILVMCKNSSEVAQIVMSKEAEKAFYIAVAIPYINGLLSVMELKKRSPSSHMKLYLSYCHNTHYILEIIAILCIMGTLGFAGCVLYFFWVCSAPRRRARERIKPSKLQLIPVMRYSKLAERAELEASSKECMICLEAFEPDSVCRMLPCKHFYHKQCIDTWLVKYVNRCPYCQARPNPNQILSPG
ncbi:uncharacterized protein NEMAJ01_1181 [Nematocida major]|uniref:uncharacterized protein n=1 Tax=Nematocida major TaxID=1912982 RepID=UPI002008450B|nr:uncharacterized protein NEMAJ01_1181 [Nematocida major]KAH9386285.1 hypothetical protein NEMAJ01_1181 [Nematocida major]